MSRILPLRLCCNMRDDSVCIYIDAVVSQHEIVEKTAASLGNLPPAPFALLSFLALPVIPELRLTDLGLVNVAEFKLLK
jgi:adenine deaminase